MQVPDLAHAVHAGADELGQRTHQRAGHRPVDDPLRDRALAGLFTKWVEDQRDWLLALGFGRRKTATALPAQATIHRFMWALEQQVVALQL